MYNMCSLLEFCSCYFDDVQVDIIKYGTHFAKTHPESERYLAFCYWTNMFLNESFKCITLS